MWLQAVLLCVADLVSTKKFWRFLALVGLTRSKRLVLDRCQLGNVRYIRADSWFSVEAVRSWSNWSGLVWFLVQWLFLLLGNRGGSSHSCLVQSDQNIRWGTVAIYVSSQFFVVPCIHCGGGDYAFVVFTIKRHLIMWILWPREILFPLIA